MPSTTRPASSDWTRNFDDNAHGERVYHLTECPSVYVTDSGGGRHPGRSRHRVRATVVDEWCNRSSKLPTHPTDPFGCTLWVVWTKGVSSHGNALTRRTFETLADAERHIRRWATRRWRVAAD